MKMTQSVLLLTSLVMVGSVSANDFQNCERHVKRPAEVILLHPNSSDSYLNRVNGHIDADVMDFHITRALQQLI